MELIELKREAVKYRKLYEDKSPPNYVLEGLKAEAFELAIRKIESDGLKETYLFFKTKRDDFASKGNRLARNLANAYGLVVGKLWKDYKKL